MMKDMKYKFPTSFYIYAYILQSKQIKKIHAFVFKKM